MINSKILNYMLPYFEIIEKSKGKTIGEIKNELKLVKENLKKGSAGLIVENLLGWNYMSKWSSCKRK